MPTLSRQMVKVERNGSPIYVAGLSETTEQIHVVKYARMQYPDILIQHDLSKGKRTPKQGAYLKQQGWQKSFPDYGLYIEFKKTGEKLFKKDAITYRTEHLQEQAEMIEKLKARGYYATFSIGFEEAKKTIDNYFKGVL